MTPAQEIPKGLPNIVRHFSTLFKKPMVSAIEKGKSDCSIIYHTGRKSGRAYHTPVEAIFLGDEVLVALVYGRKTDWLQNVLAQGGCTIFYKLQTYTAKDPKIFTLTEARNLLPPESHWARSSSSPGEYLRMNVKIQPVEG